MKKNMIINNNNKTAEKRVFKKSNSLPFLDLWQHFCLWYRSLNWTMLNVNTKQGATASNSTRRTPESHMLYDFEIIQRINVLSLIKQFKDKYRSNSLEIKRPNTDFYLINITIIVEGTHQQLQTKNIRLYIKSARSGVCKCTLSTIFKY